jgi:hypothetical protein
MNARCPSCGRPLELETTGALALWLCPLENVTWPVPDPVPAERHLQVVPDYPRSSQDADDR